jgi:ferredoxin
MSEEIKKHPLNIAGRYYVDCDTCIDHALCVEAAPNNFKQDEEYIAYVFKQPDSPEEEAQCRQAMNVCPVRAIGNDG